MAGRSCRRSGSTAPVQRQGCAMDLCACRDVAGIELQQGAGGVAGGRGGLLAALCCWGGNAYSGLSLMEEDQACAMGGYSCTGKEELLPFQKYVR